MVAAYAMFAAVERVRGARTPALRYLWLTSGAVAIGFAWGMGAMMMLAVHLPGFLAHERLVGLASVVPAIAGSAFAMLALSSRQRSWGRLHRALVFAVGISAMHYIRMESV